jgi:hypothetical protein
MSARLADSGVNCRNGPVAAIRDPDPLPIG